MDFKYHSYVFLLYFLNFFVFLTFADFFMEVLALKFPKGAVPLERLLTLWKLYSMLFCLQKYFSMVVSCFHHCEMVCIFVIDWKEINMVHKVRVTTAAVEPHLHGKYYARHPPKKWVFENNQSVIMASTP